MNIKEIQAVVEETIQRAIKKSQEEILKVIHTFAKSVDERFEQVDQRFEQMETRMETRFVEIDQRFNVMDGRFNDVLNGQDDIIKRLERVEQEVTFWNPAITKTNKRLKLV